MKELLAFAFAILFISCQNQPFNHLSTSPTPQVTLAANSEMAVDVAAELTNPKLPGFYYRETPVRSEFDTENGYKDLTCISQVSSSEDSEEVAVTSTNTATADNELTEIEGWGTLTQKWEYQPATRTCIDSDAQSESPSCKEAVFVIETGKLISTLAIN